MFKKTLLSLVVCVGFVSSVSAQDELKADILFLPLRGLSLG